MRWLNPRQKAAVTQHWLPRNVETLINHVVAEQERLREEHEQARKQPQRILRHNDVV